MYRTTSDNEIARLVCRYLNGDKSAHDELGALLKQRFPCRQNNNVPEIYQGKNWSRHAGKNRNWGK